MYRLVHRYRLQDRIQCITVQVQATDWDAMHYCTGAGSRLLHRCRLQINVQVQAADYCTNAGRRYCSGAGGRLLYRCCWQSCVQVQAPDCCTVAGGILLDRRRPRLLQLTAAVSAGS